MPVFTAGAAAIATAIGFTAGTTGFIIAQSLIAAGLAAGTGHLLGVFDDGGLPPVEDPGVEQRLGANTQNRVPILYGQFMQRGSLTYAEISADRQTLYTVITLGEGPITSIDKIFWDDIELTLDAAGEVVSGVDVEGNAVTRLTGQLNVQTYLGTAVANNSTYLEGLVTDWTSNHKMTNLVYAVVTVRYNRDNDVTNLSDMRFIGTAPINSPAEAVIDQLTNVRHGLGLSPTVIDSDSFNAAQVYYQTMLPYTDASGVTRMAERFQVNGSLNSADPVFERIEAILLGSNSSLRWQGGKYSIFINKADTVEAFNMNESRVVGDIQVSEVGLNSVVNSVEVQYGRDPSNNYQRNTVTVDLPTANRYPNELDRVRSIDLPLARTFVEAERIAYILLNQSREQLSIKHMATVEAMPLEAGDVITYTLPNYGWNAKQFRITRVSEMEVEDGLQYQIEAVEYAASVYTDRTHIEPGASPNTSLPDIASIPAVTDLQVIATDTAAAIPAFTLQWTTPPNSRVESFDIFANLVDTDFSSGSTALVNSVRSTSGIYTAGSTVSSQISTVSAGTVTVWVVARNSNANSDPSNAATFLWNPASATSTDNLGYRFHNNVVTIDPGAPTGIDGKGGDWYERGDALDVSNPHWEAVGAGRAFGGSQREVSFTVTGTAASVESTEVDIAQQIRFDLSGTIGEREQVMFDRPEITEFTFDGTTANVSGQREFWALDFTGNSDAADPSAMEEFYIHLTGNSAPADTDGELYLYLTGNSSDGSGSTTTSYTANGFGGASSIDIENTSLTWFFGGSGNDIAAFLSDVFGLTTSDIEINTDYNPIISGSVRIGTSINSATFSFDETSTINFSAFDFSAPFTWSGITLTVGNPYDGTISGVPLQIIQTTNSSVNLTISADSISEEIELTNNLTGSTALRNDALASIQAITAITSLYTVSADVAPSGITGVPTGSPIVKFVQMTPHTASISATFTDAMNGDLSGSQAGTLVSPVITNASQVQISIPTESIDETFMLTGELTTATTLRNDLLTSIQAVTAITDEFTVTADVASGITGVTDGQPIIKLVANDNIDHSIGVTFTDGDGDLTGSAFGTLVEGETEEVTTEIRITYDSTLSPSFQDIVIGGAADAAAIAGVVAPMIDGHGELTAAQATGTTSVESVNVEVDDLRASTGSANTSRLAFRLTPAQNNNYFAEFLTESNPDNDNQTLATTAGDIQTISIVFDQGPFTTGDHIAAGFGYIEEYFTTNVNAPVWVGDGSSAVLVRVGAKVSSTYYTTRYSYFSGETVVMVAEAYEVEVLDTIGTLPISDGTTGSTVVVPRVPYVSDTNSAIDFFNTTDVDILTADMTPDATQSRVVIRANVNSNFSQPILSIVERGTSSAFTQTASTLIEGTASLTAAMPTSYQITLDGTEVGAGEFGALNDGSLMASTVASIINGLPNYGATVTEGVVTATAGFNGPDELVVIITAGTSTGLFVDSAAVAKVVTQVGNDADVFAGTDAMISPMIGTDGIGTVNAAGMTFAEITAAVAALYTTDGRYTPTAGTSSLLLVSTFAGDSPQTTWTVDPGTEVVGGVAIPATLAADRIVISNGIGISDEGVRSSYVIAVGGTNVVTGTFASGAGQNTAASELVVGLTGVSEYIGSVMDNVATATSVVLGEEDDITITITAGTNADGTTPTIAVAKAVVEPGERPELDFTNTVWNYFVINQEIRVDDDTIDMMPDNTLQIRRGIIEDVDTIRFDATTDTVDGDITVTTTDKPSTLIVLGAAVTTDVATATPTDFISVDLQVSTDGGTNYTTVFEGVHIIIGYGATYAGQLFSQTHSINVTIDADASSTYNFRLVKTGVGQTFTGLGATLAVLEELRAV